ncbi:alpha/beta hydrolase family protein [Salinisphaera aquimarina]|uniref:Alpha/beta fold hydrolase n=1 Tax=Salinisphaera aquimarina TaxID=2094031 RepID=A0ABV7ERZ0_9GAMM
MTTSTPELQRVHTPSGYDVPVSCWHADSQAPLLLFMGALGVGCAFYAKLGAALSASGVHVALLEQRGYGDSALRPSRNSDWGFADIVGNDLAAVLTWATAHFDASSQYLMGHSLGGHYAAIGAGLYPNQVDGLIVVATGSPWFEAYEDAVRRKIHWLTWLIPPCNALFGYYPGDRLGFGGREARTVMSDWRALARTNRYRAAGLSQDLEDLIDRYTGPVLAIRLADDALAPEAAVDALTDKFSSAAIEIDVVDRDTLGDRADHFRWARTPGAVVDRIGRWLPDASGTHSRR